MSVWRKRVRLFALTLVASFTLIGSYLLLRNYFAEIINDGNTQLDSGCGYFVREQMEKVSDALGNLMFMYASYYGMVKKQEDIAKKTTFVWGSDIPSPYGHLPLRDVFANLSIPEKILPDSWFSSKKFIRLDEAKCSVYDGTGLDKLSCDGKNVMVSGCRQSFRYFDNVIEEIRNEFTFKKSIQEKCVSLFENSLAKKRLKREACITVAVHLRRGDFTSDFWFNYGLRAAQFDYLQKAIRYHENAHYQNKTKIVDCLVFLIFGNDHEWNLNASKQVELLRPEKTHLILIDPKKSTAAIDLCAMRLCDHMILSVGSFGWWAGLFSRGIVTYQKEYALFNSTVYNAYDPEGYFLSHWIPL